MRAGDRRERFERLYTAHYPEILAYVHRRTGSPDDAADAIAETFMTAWRRLDDILDNARLWLYGAARRVLANQRRGESRRIALAARLRAELAAWAEPPGEPDTSAVRDAFRRLTDDDRELLSLVGKIIPGYGTRGVEAVQGRGTCAQYLDCPIALRVRDTLRVRATVLLGRAGKPGEPARDAHPRPRDRSGCADRP